jgi:hypothetical protein
VSARPWRIESQHDGHWERDDFPFCDFATRQQAEQVARLRHWHAVYGVRVVNVDEEKP